VLVRIAGGCLPVRQQGLQCKEDQQAKMQRRAPSNAFLTAASLRHLSGDNVEPCSLSGDKIRHCNARRNQLADSAIVTTKPNLAAASKALNIRALNEVASDTSWLNRVTL